MNCILRLDQVGLRLDAFQLEDVSFALEKGDYFAVLGPSGCGKTTLLKLVAGFYRRHAGIISFQGIDAGRLPAHKRSVGYVAQDSWLFPHLNVRKNIEFGLRYSKAGREQSASWLERIVDILGVAGLMERDPSTLSGGESRRVALARSLAVSPGLLLLDEPLAMLDPPARIGLAEMLGRIHVELGMTTIHVTHDFDEVLALASRCAVMKQGRIEQIGSVRDVMERPGNDFVAGFVNASQEWRTRLQARMTD